MPRGLLRGVPYLHNFIVPHKQRKGGWFCVLSALPTRPRAEARPHFCRVYGDSWLNWRPFERTSEPLHGASRPRDHPLFVPSQGKEVVFSNAEPYISLWRIVLGYRMQARDRPPCRPSPRGGKGGLPNAHDPRVERESKPPPSYRPRRSERGPCRNASCINLEVFVPGEAFRPGTSR